MTALPTRIRSFFAFLLKRERHQAGLKESSTESTRESAGERAVESASERAVENAGERAVESASDRAVESAGERAVESASERAVENAGERAVESAKEEAAERAVESAKEEAAERAVESAKEEAAERADQNSAENSVPDSSAPGDIVNPTLKNRRRFYHLPRKIQRRYGQFGSMMILPLSCLALAGLLMTLADLMARLAVPYAEVLMQTGLIVFRYAPLLVAVGLVNSLIVHEKGLAVFAAALAAVVWLAAATAIVREISLSEAQTDYDLGWLTGLASGLMTFSLYRFTERKIRSPRLVRFLNPRTLVIWQIPLAAIGGVLSGLLWLLAERCLIRLAQWISQAGEIGLFVYGLANRLLLPVGLHHVLDHQLWQRTGDFTTQSGSLIQGDLARFLAGDPTAGQFTAGFYPVMLIVIPAALTAAWLAGRATGKPLPLTLLLVAAAGSLFGGLTDVADLIILLISPLFYLFYAALTGLSMLLSAQLQVLHGFSFSAGLIDYLAFWTQATRPEWLLLIGTVLGAIAFSVIYLAMKFFRWSGPAAGQEQASMIRERIEEEAASHE